MVRDPRLVSLYEKKFEDVRRHERTDNVWAAERGMNVLFTPAKSGPRPIEKLFEWIDAENEFIALSVFDLKDLKSPTDQKKLTEKLIEAKPVASKSSSSPIERRVMDEISMEIGS